MDGIDSFASLSVPYGVDAGSILNEDKLAWSASCLLSVGLP